MWAERTTTAKAWRWEHAWHSSKTARRPARLTFREQRRSSCRCWGVRLQEVPEASVGTIVFTPRDMGNLGKVSTYIVTGSVGLLSEVCWGQGWRQRTSQGATAVIQASSNGSNGKGAVMGFVCSKKPAR